MRFLRRQADPVGEAPQTVMPEEVEPEPAPEPAFPPGVAFDGLTEDWRIVGRIVLAGRAADPLDSIARSLNSRDPVELHDTKWASLDAPDALEPAPGLSRMSAYDLVAIIAADPGEPPMSDGELDVYQVRKTASPVELELPPFRVLGTHFVEGRAEADHLLRRYGALFVPIADATLHLGNRLLNDRRVQTILVNRLYIKGVRILDREWLKISGLPADSPLARRIAAAAVRTVAPAPPELGRPDSKR